MQVKAKKKFGQNFLIDESVLSRIFEATPKEATNIVEIGGGLGYLTQWLLKTKANVGCFEIDPELVVVLQDKFQEQINLRQLTIFSADVLTCWEKLGGNGEYVLVANLPYYVATNIILRALQDEKCTHLVVMIQKEVAQKFAAASGEREFCALSVLARLVSTPKILFDVPAAAFNPPPKVTSSVIEFDKTCSTPQALELVKNEAFCNFLRKAFSAPRKKVLNNLNLKEISYIPQNARPHELCVNDYLKLFKGL